jgi:hypothetical protein
MNSRQSHFHFAANESNVTAQMMATADHDECIENRRRDSKARDRLVNEMAVLSEEDRE